MNLKRKRKLLKLKHKLQNIKVGQIFSFIFKLIFVAALGYFIYFFFFSNFFYIRDIKILGTETIDKQEFLNIVNYQLEQKHYKIVPNRHILFFSKQDLEQRLYQEYLFSNLEIVKKLPDILEIRLKERQGSLVWVTNSNFYLMDYQGIIIKTLSRPKRKLLLPIFNITNQPITNPESENIDGEETTEINPETDTETEETPEITEEEKIIEYIKEENYTNFPFIYDDLNQNTQLGVQVLKNDQIDKILDTYDKLKQSGFITSNIHFNSVSHEIIYQDETKRIITNSNQDADTIEKYYKISKEKNFNFNEYLDLKLAPKIFYK